MFLGYFLAVRMLRNLPLIRLAFTRHHLPEVKGFNRPVRGNWRLLREKPLVQYCNYSIREGCFLTPPVKNQRFLTAPSIRGGQGCLREWGGGTIWAASLTRGPRLLAGVGWWDDVGIVPYAEGKILWSIETHRKAPGEDSPGASLLCWIIHSCYSR